MKIVKTSGESAWNQRRMTMHDSTAEWSLQVTNGKFNRAAEKPGDKFTSQNENKRSRGSKGPRRLWLTKIMLYVKTITVRYYQL